MEATSSATGLPARVIVSRSPRRAHSTTSPLLVPRVADPPMAGAGTEIALSPSTMKHHADRCCLTGPRTVEDCAPAVTDP